MDISLPKAVLDGLPAPDDQGLVRVTVALRIGPDGDAKLVEVNDTPVPDAGAEAEGKAESGADQALPSPADVAGQMY